MVVIKVKKLHFVATNRADEGIVTERKKNRVTPFVKTA